MAFLDFNDLSRNYYDGFIAQFLSQKAQVHSLSAQLSAEQAARAEEAERFDGTLRMQQAQIRDLSGQLSTERAARAGEAERFNGTVRMVQRTQQAQIHDLSGQLSAEKAARAGDFERLNGILRMQQKKMQDVQAELTSVRSEKEGIVKKLGEKHENHVRGVRFRRDEQYKKFEDEIRQLKKQLHNTSAELRSVKSEGEVKVKILDDLIEKQQKDVNNLNAELAAERVARTEEVERVKERLEKARATPRCFKIINKRDEHLLTAPYEVRRKEWDAERTARDEETERLREYTEKFKWTLSKTLEYSANEADELTKENDQLRHELEEQKEKVESLSTTLESYKNFFDFDSYLESEQKCEMHVQRDLARASEAVMTDKLEGAAVTRSYSDTTTDDKPKCDLPKQEEDLEEDVIVLEDESTSNATKMFPLFSRKRGMDDVGGHSSKRRRDDSTSHGAVTKKKREDESATGDEEEPQ